MKTLNPEPEVEPVTEVELQHLDKEVSALTVEKGNDDQMNAKVTHILERLESKRYLVAKRIETKEIQEEALSKISTLYGRWIKDVREKCEKQLRIIQKGLFADLKTKQSLDHQLKNIKQRMYEAVQALEDHVTHSSDELAFNKGDIIFVMSKFDDSRWYGQHSDSGKEGVFPGKIVTEMKTFSSVRHSADSADEAIAHDAEEILHTIEVASRKDKLGGFFGASNSEIDKGIMESKDSKERQRTDSKGSPGSLLRKIIGKRGESSENLFKEMVKARQEPITEETKQRLLTFLSHHSAKELLQTPRDFIRDGELELQVLGSGLIKAEKHLAHVFLFSDIIVFTSKKHFKLKACIPLSDVRIILVADDGNYKDALQLSYKGIRYTLMAPPTSSDGSQLRDSWFKDLKQLERPFQLRKFTRHQAFVKPNT